MLTALAPPEPADGQAGLRSVSIAVSVIDCFATHRELGATQVARELGVAKSTPAQGPHRGERLPGGPPGQLAAGPGMREKEHDRPYDPPRFAELVSGAVLDVVRRQAAAGLDIVTDGEQGKVSFLTYVKERLAGFDQLEGETLLPPSWQREIDDFPEYYHSYMSKYSSAVAPMRVMVCTGPVAYSGQPALAGHENVIASADCGFSSRASFAPEVHPTVVWAKFAALAEGAAIETKRLWGGS